MQNIRKYKIITESNLEIKKIDDRLCILNFATHPDKFKVKTLIEHNPDVQFWLVVPNVSKDDVVWANELGIKNVLPHPINENIIDKYLEGLSANQNNENSQAPLKPLNNIKIMIVDDNIMNIELLEEALRGLGICIEAYTQPQNAIENIKQNHYDLFLLDILMPEISGYDISEAIKQTQNKNSPIVFISALSDYEYKLTGYNSGACLYIEKPFDVEITRRQIYNLLKKEEIKKNFNKSKDEFLAMITHDLKTPISAEINALKLLLKNNLGELNEPQQEILTDILSSAKFLKTMTDNILCSYKQNNSEIEFRPEKHDLITVIENCINETKYLLKDKEINLKFETNLTKAPVFIDIIEIKRVINNLIGNASDYAPIKSQITLNLTKLNNEFIFSITDQGAGINLPNPNDIFECNMTLAKTNKRIGFGLGLFISKNIITSHGGRIFAQSELNKGTTITFTIPE